MRQKVERAVPARLSVHGVPAPPLDGWHNDLKHRETRPALAKSSGAAREDIASTLLMPY